MKKNTILALIVHFIVPTMMFQLGVPQALATDRPNVIWMIADDLSPDLGCYGYEGVNTPNIDRLAAQGAKYTSAFSATPVCSSSRSGFITGVHPTTTGTHQHRARTKVELPKPIQPITTLMRQRGYFICNGNSSLNRSGKSDYNFAFQGEMYDGVDWSLARVAVRNRTTANKTVANKTAENRDNRSSLKSSYTSHIVTS